jgi:hypothetical protein
MQVLLQAMNKQKVHRITLEVIVILKAMSMKSMESILYFPMDNLRLKQQNLHQLITHTDKELSLVSLNIPLIKFIKLIAYQTL